jgi:outer membrane immunogenic protein
MLFARVAAVGTTAIALCMPAYAADIAARPYAPPPPPLPMLYDWTGFYLGAHFGGSFSSETMTVSAVAFDTNPSGVLGGFQVGYNYQFAPNMLIGFEGEMAWTSASSSAGTALPFAAVTATSSHNWYDTAVGRFGVLQSGWLFYGKLGLAWMNADYTVAAVPGFSSTLNTTRGGWTIGVGAEYRFTPAWSAKLEYDFLDFGTNNYGFSVGGPTAINTQVHEFKVGVNYHFMPGTLFGRF